MRMTHPNFHELMVLLTGDRTPRVWSLLVTVFGELAQGEGTHIKGTLLSKLMPLMGVKPEAMRVALHRLRKDGWIQSERNGRTSSYALTDWGRAQSALATPRIYNLAPLPQEAWIVVFDPSQSVRDLEVDGTWVASNILVSSKRPRESQAYIAQILPDQALPKWMETRICSPETAQGTKAFLDRLDRLQGRLEQCAPLDCFETSAMRILIVDGWRRLVLKTPNLPPHTFPQDWAGPDCRDAVASLLNEHRKQDLHLLEASL